MTDEDISTKFHWTRPHALSSESRAEILWTIPKGTPPGSYRWAAAAAACHAAPGNPCGGARQDSLRADPGCTGRRLACPSQVAACAGCVTLGTTRGSWAARSPSAGHPRPLEWGSLRLGQACGLGCSAGCEACSAVGSSWRSCWGRPHVQAGQACGVPAGGCCKLMMLGTHASHNIC